MRLCRSKRLGKQHVNNRYVDRETLNRYFSKWDQDLPLSDSYSDKSTVKISAHSKFSLVVGGGIQGLSSGITDSEAVVTVVVVVDIAEYQNEVGMEIRFHAFIQVISICYFNI